MKKICKILGIIAIIAAIGFSMTACKDDEDFPDPPKQFLTVEGIPSPYINKYGIILLTPPNSTDINVYSALEKINSTSISFPLYIRENNAPWEGSGNFCVKILIFENAATEQRTYQGVIESTNITASTVITWSSFIPK
jgi:hypothetical protein